MTLKDYFKIKVYPQYGGTMGEYEDLVTIKTFFNESITGRLDALEASYGDYTPVTEGHTAADDLEEVFADVETASTGLKARLAVLDTAVSGKVPVLEGEMDVVQEQAYKALAIAEDPVQAVAATVAAEANSGIVTFTAKLAGDAAEGISIQLVGGTTTASLAVTSVAARAIVIQLTVADSAVTTTAQQLAALIEEGVAANDVAARAIIGAVASGTQEGLCEAGTHLLASGTNGTTGAIGTLRFTADKLWVATTECTVSDATGWLSTALA